MHQEVICSIPGQGTCPGCGPDPQWGACRRRPIDVLSHRCFYLSLSLPLSLKSIKEKKALLLWSSFFLFFYILTRGHFSRGHFSIFVQTEWEGERGRDREKHRRERDTSSGCHLHDPTRAGDKLQPRYMPLARTEPGSLWTAGQHSNR
uniref:Uncharacterized protein n=1 Tax=Molossus molossus TaxID=27622 RepID=A0A7J8I9D8_MOLMO|nr:hypothetical protein HJG59_010664 [Molossus molossus]